MTGPPFLVPIPAPGAHPFLWCPFLPVVTIPAPWAHPAGLDYADLDHEDDNEGGSAGKKGTRASHTQQLGSGKNLVCDGARSVEGALIAGTTFGGR